MPWIYFFQFEIFEIFERNENIIEKIEKLQKLKQFLVLFQYNKNIWSQATIEQNP